MSIVPDAKWIDALTRLTRDVPHIDFNEYFTSNRVSNRYVQVVTAGTLEVTSGHVCVVDSGLSKGAPGYFRVCPTGVYPVEASILLPNDDVEPPLLLAVRVLISDEKVDRYEIAARGDEDIEFDPDRLELYVESGVLAILDAEFADALNSFVMGRMSTTGAESVRDVFAGMFEESYDADPDFQDRDGSWAEWCSEGGVFATLFRLDVNRFVVPYWGLDRQGVPCQLVVPVIGDVSEHMDDLYGLEEPFPKGSDECKSDLARILSILPRKRTYDTKLQLCDDYWRLGRYDEALEVLENIRSKGERSVAWHMRRGLVLTLYAQESGTGRDEAARMLQEARAAYETCMGIDGEMWVRMECMEHIQEIDGLMKSL